MRMFYERYRQRRIRYIIKRKIDQKSKQKHQNTSWSCRSRSWKWTNDALLDHFTLFIFAFFLFSSFPLSYFSLEYKLRADLVALQHELSRDASGLFIVPSDQNFRWIIANWICTSVAIRQSGMEISGFCRRLIHRIRVLRDSVYTSAFPIEAVQGVS